MKRLLAATATALLLVAGCSGGGSDPAARGGAAVSSTAGSLLAKYGLAGRSTVEVIDRLDRLAGSDRPADFTASVRPHELQLSRGDDKAGLAIPPDRFYLSIAPYVDGTHKCFYHSLTTCEGELGGKRMQVRIVDDNDGKVLVDETVSTFANGFVGFWLPRNVKATLRVSYGDKAGQSAISTDDDAPTCLTTLRLV